jgi:hypothetical protein
MPNLANAPRNAISSVGICPVERNATDSGPCSSMIARKRVTKVATADSQSMGRRRPLASRHNGVRARSSAASGASASHPLGHAMPRLTGYSVVGVRLTATPSRRCTSSEQPVEQKPHTIDVVASGRSRLGTCPNPNPPGDRTSSRVSAPSRRRRRFIAVCSRR